MRKFAFIAIGIAAFAFAFAAADTHTVSAQEVDTKTKTTPEKVIVKVVEGDTLSGIAEDHDTTYVRIFNANESIDHPDVINPGQELRIPNGDEELKERALPQASAYTSPSPSRQTTNPTRNTYTPQQTPAASYPVSPDAAKAFIYSHESGNNPNATNPNGCYGIGQDCNGVVRGQCGADYACQDAYFTSYMARRYGSWEAALAFWKANGWW